MAHDSGNDFRITSTLETRVTTFTSGWGDLFSSVTKSHIEM